MTLIEQLRCTDDERISKLFFSDQKSRGFHLDKSHISKPERLARLLIASCLAYIWLVYLGVCALEDDWMNLLHRKHRCDLSLFRLGLRLLTRCLKECLPLPKGCYFQHPYPPSSFAPFKTSPI